MRSSFNLSMFAPYALRFISMKKLILFWSRMSMELWQKMILEDLSAISVEKGICMRGMMSSLLLLLKTDIILYGWLWDLYLCITFPKVISEIIRQYMGLCWQNLNNSCQPSKNRSWSKPPIPKPTWWIPLGIYFQEIETRSLAAWATDKTMRWLISQQESNQVVSLS